MPSPLDSDATRRLLIAAGTARFEGLADSDLPSVPAELDRIVTSFTKLGYERIQAQHSSDPESTQLRSLFSQVKRESRAGDVVVAYYTGHGARDLERFYLLARNSLSSDLFGTALAADDLARALTNDLQASQVLMILDACYAGAGAAEFLQTANYITKALSGDLAVFVIAAARSKQEASQGALSSALTYALANERGRIGGRAQSFLAIDDVMDEVDKYLREKHSTQIATWSVANVRGRCRLFPNPLYSPEIGPGLDLESQRAFAEHWVPKARSAEIGVGGWYFTGREEALRELVKWLSATHSDGKVRVITGGPGSGKSALLARIVTLADPAYRKEILSAPAFEALQAELLPPEGVVDVAMHVRQKRLADVVSQISADLDLPARNPAELPKALRQRAKKTVIIVDALDESDDKDQIISQLLRPLADIQHVLLLVGTRPDTPGGGRRVKAFGESTVEINLDFPKYIGPSDIARYVERRLLATEEPGRSTIYRVSPETVRMVAEAVADRANGVFLVAHAAVQALLTAPSIVDVLQPGWADQLPTGLESALRLFLYQLDARQPDGLTSEKVRAVLLPLAFGAGEGFPWGDLWASTAAALGDLPVSDLDVELACKYAAAFIVEAIEQDRSVYRLYHEQLAELLRGSPAVAKGGYARIVDHMRSLTPTIVSGITDWSRAHPHVRRYLASYAAKAGQLNDLLMDPAFLVAADVDVLLGEISTASSLSDPAQQAANIFRTASHCLRDASAGEGASYLELFSAQNRQAALAERFQRLPYERPWRPLWTISQMRVPHSVIRGHETAIETVCETTVNDVSIACTGDGGGRIRIWNIDTGTQIALLGERPFAISALAVADTRIGTVLISGDREGGIDCWELNQMTKLWAKRGVHWSVRAIDIVNSAGGSFAMVSGSTFISIHGLIDGESVAPTAGGLVRGGVSYYGLGSDETLSSLATCRHADEDFIISGDSTGVIHIRTVDNWDVRHRFKAHSSEISHLKTLKMGGKTAIISASGDAIRIWDFDTLQLTTEIATGAGPNCMLRFDVANVQDMPLIAFGADLDLHVFNIDGRKLASVREAHNDWISGAAIHLGTNHARIITAGGDRSVRTWVLDDLIRSGLNSTIKDDVVTSVAQTVIDGSDTVVCGHESGAISLLDASTGTHLTEVQQGVGGRVSQTLVLGSSSLQLIVSSSRPEIVVWNLTSGVWTRFLPPSGTEVASCSAALFGDSPIVVAGTDRGMVLVGNFSKPGELVGGFLAHQHNSPNQADPRVFPSSVSSVALLERDGQPCIVTIGWEDRTIHLWDYDGSSIQALPVGRIGHPMGSWRNTITQFALCFQTAPMLFAVGDLDGVCTIWNTEAVGSPIRIRDTDRAGASGNWVSALQFSRMAERDLVAIAYRSGEVCVHDASTGYQIVSIQTGSFVWPGGLSINDAGKLVVASRSATTAFQIDVKWLQASAAAL